MALAIDEGPTDVALLDETIGANVRRTIAAYGDNAEWTLLQYATATVGAILVNINPAYRTHEYPRLANARCHDGGPLVATDRGDGRRAVPGGTTMRSPTTMRC